MTHRDEILTRAAQEQSFHKVDIRAPWFLINPRNSWVVWWTLFSSLVLLYIAVFTPYEVAFMSPATEASDPLFVLGRIVDLVFALDMMLQFFLLVPKAGGSAGDLETRWGYIVRSYLRGWFILDFVSLAASAFDIIPVFSHVERNSNERVTSIMTSFRIVRILRLIKLVRLLRASRRLKDWLTKVPTPRATLTILILLVRCFFVSHWFACILGLITQFEQTPLTTWYATHGFCEPIVDEENIDHLNGLRGYASGTQVDLTLIDWRCVSHGELYLNSVWWSVGMLFGAPISITPHKGPYERTFIPEDDTRLLRIPEMVVVLTLKVFVAFEWVTVLAQFVRVYNECTPPPSLHGSLKRSRLSCSRPPSNTPHAALS